MKQVKCLIILLAMLTLGNKSVVAQNILPQNLEKLRIMEDSMSATIDSMFGAFLPDTHVGYSERLIKQLVKALKIPNSYYYSFPKIKEKLNIISPEDNSFRIFNWSVDWNVIFNRYYGAIQMPGEQLKLYGLSDYTEKIGLGIEDSVLTNGKWLGAIYYKILFTPSQGRRIYTLFGLSTGSPISNKKILEPLVIENDRVVFGAPIFNYPSRNNPRNAVNRFVLEYKKDVHVGLTWDNTKGMIMFDELASQINDPSKRSTYVPTGQYNGLIWGNDMWNFRQNIMQARVLQDGEAPGDEEEKK